MIVLVENRPAALITRDETWAKEIWTWADKIQAKRLREGADSLLITAGLENINHCRVRTQADLGVVLSFPLSIVLILSLEELTCATHLAMQEFSALSDILGGKVDKLHSEYYWDFEKELVAEFSPQRIMSASIKSYLIQTAWTQLLSTFDMPSSQFIPSFISLNGKFEYDLIKRVIEETDNLGLHPISFEERARRYGLTLEEVLHDVCIPFALGNELFSFNEKFRKLVEQLVTEHFKPAFKNVV